jgi:hypothetical protein
VVGADVERGRDKRRDGPMVRWAAARSAWLDGLTSIDVKTQHGSTSADAPRPAKMGTTPAVGLLARGLYAARLPGRTQWHHEHRFTADSCGGSSGLAG